MRKRCVRNSKVFTTVDVPTLRKTLEENGRHVNMVSWYEKL